MWEAFSTLIQGSASEIMQELDENMVWIYLHLSQESMVEPHLWCSVSIAHLLSFAPDLAIENLLELMQFYNSYTQFWPQNQLRCGIGHIKLLADS